MSASIRDFPGALFRCCGHTLSWRFVFDGYLFHTTCDLVIVFLFPNNELRIVEDFPVLFSSTNSVFCLIHTLFRCLLRTLVWRCFIYNQEQTIRGLFQTLFRCFAQEIFRDFGKPVFQRFIFSGLFMVFHILFYIYSRFCRNTLSLPFHGNFDLKVHNQHLGYPLSSWIYNGKECRL